MSLFEEGFRMLSDLKLLEEGTGGRVQGDY